MGSSALLSRRAEKSSDGRFQGQRAVRLRRHHRLGGLLVAGSALACFLLARGEAPAWAPVRPACSLLLVWLRSQLPLLSLLCTVPLVAASGFGGMAVFAVVIAAVALVGFHAALKELPAGNRRLTDHAPGRGAAGELRTAADDMGGGAGKQRSGLPCWRGSPCWLPALWPHRTLAASRN